MSVKLLTEHHLELLSLKGDYTGSSESTLVKMPHCWKSHVTAHFISQRLWVPYGLYHLTGTIVRWWWRTKISELSPFYWISNLLMMSRSRPQPMVHCGTFVKISRNLKSSMTLVSCHFLILFPSFAMYLCCFLIYQLHMYFSIYCK